MLALVVPLTVGATQAGDITFPVLVGTNVWTYTYAQGGQPAKTVTPGDQFVLIQAVGIGYAVTDRVRMGFFLQFTEALSNPPATGSFTGFSVAPSVAYTFWGPLTVGLNTNFVLRRKGISEFGFGLNGNLYASFPLGAGFSFIGGLSVQQLLTPVISTGLIPFAGLSLKLAGP